MYRINSISKHMVSLQVFTDGKFKFVNLLPGNFVFSEKLTEQLKNLQNQRCIRIHEVPAYKSGTSTSKVADKTTAKEITNKESTKTSKVSGSTVKLTGSSASEKGSSTSSK